jgi:hypothetical protein
VYSEGVDSSLPDTWEIRQEDMTLQKDREEKDQKHVELSAVWQELLGRQGGTSAKPASSPEGATTPTLESDPWSRLLHAKGIEMVDLEQLHLHMSEQDVEHLLEIMREQSEQDVQANDDQSTD